MRPRGLRLRRPACSASCQLPAPPNPPASGHPKVAPRAFGPADAGQLSLGAHRMARSGRERRATAATVRWWLRRAPMPVTLSATIWMGSIRGFLPCGGGGGLRDCTFPAAPPRGSGPGVGPRSRRFGARPIAVADLVLRGSAHRAAKRQAASGQAGQARCAGGGAASAVRRSRVASWHR